MYLGIDLGTSELKVVLLDEQHSVVASVAEALTSSRPHPQWSEQAPADWWAALDHAMQRLHATQPAALAQVRAIGLAGQMHGAVLLDAGAQVLRPAILWNDGRSAAQCAWLEAALPTLHTLTGNLAMPGFTAPKLLWVREHEPALFARTASVLLPKDWLRLALTGEQVSEMSDASGTLWLDVGRRCWSEAVLAACGLTLAQMPRLVEGSEVSGQLRPALAKRWGLGVSQGSGGSGHSVAVAGGAGDNAASAVGVGAVRPGQGFISLGTSGVIFLAGDRFRPNPGSAVHAFCHALPQRWHQMSVMLSAGSAVRWGRTLLGLPSEAALLELAASTTRDQRARAPLFLPYLSGERTPHNDADAQGVLFGLIHEHDAASVSYAVVEGVCLGLLDGWRSFGRETEAVASLAVVGGGARSDFWAQMLASALQVTVHSNETSHASAAVGAARLAWLAVGGDEGEVCRTHPSTREFRPDAAESAGFARRGARYRALYPALRAEFAPQPEAADRAAPHAAAAASQAPRRHD